MPIRVMDRFVFKRTGLRGQIKTVSDSGSISATTATAAVLPSLVGKTRTTSFFLSRIACVPTRWPSDFHGSASGFGQHSDIRFPLSRATIVFRASSIDLLLPVLAGSKKERKKTRSAPRRSPKHRKNVPAEQGAAITLGLGRHKCPPSGSQPEGEHDRMRAKTYRVLCSWLRLSGFCFLQHLRVHALI